MSSDLQLRSELRVAVYCSSTVRQTAWEQVNLPAAVTTTVILVAPAAAAAAAAASID